MPRATLERAIAASLCFGAYLDERQVAFARLVTDGATFAYLAEVFVLPAHRGQGLYAKFGFASPARPERLMEILDFDLYTRVGGDAEASA